MTYSILISSKQLQTILDVIALLAIAMGFLVPRFGRRFYRAAESRLKEIARARRKAIFVAAALPLAVRVLFLPLFPIPRPYVHDEFSYLLMADTFAHGRIANPVPPEWKHFETEYVLLQPSYASQYQPGQGAMLAAGQVITGQPWWGVWASVGLMCGLLCWALGGVLSPGWALFGALAAALQFGIFGFWMNSYFGGALTACGGALVFGSLLRMRRKPVSSSFLCGLGLMLLLATRPAEGALWGIIAGAWIIVRNRRTLLRSVFPCTAICAAGIVLLAGYDYRVTDHPLEPPYLEGRVTYGTPQSFWWQPAVMVSHFDNPQLRDNYLNQLAFWQRRSSFAALWDSTWRRARDFWRFYIGPFLTVALPFLVYLWRDRKMRPWIIASVLFIADHATYHAWYPQQSASETVLIILLLTQCWRHLRAWGHRRHAGLAISRNLAVAFSLAIFLVAGARAADLSSPGGIPAVRKILASLLPAMKPRDRVIEELKTIPGKHLVFVYYPPDHPYIDEWVFNGAQIPGDRIVFGRLIDSDSDSALIQAMKGYAVWVVNSDTGLLAKSSNDLRSPELLSQIPADPIPGRR